MDAVVLTAAMRGNLQALQLTQSLVDSTQQHLSTGKKVNSALNNPQNFFAAQSLSNRASDLTRLLDGIGQSIQTVKTADKGVTALTGLVEQAQSLANEGREEVADGGLQATIIGDRDLRGIDDFVRQLAIPNGSTFSIQVSDETTHDAVFMDVDGLNTDVTSIAFRPASNNNSSSDEVTSIGDLLNRINSLRIHGTGEQLFNACLDSNGHLQILTHPGYKIRFGFDNTVPDSVPSVLGFGQYTRLAENDGQGTLYRGFTVSSEVALQSYHYTDITTSKTATRKSILGNLREGQFTPFVSAGSPNNDLDFTLITKSRTIRASDITGSAVLSDLTIGQFLDIANNRPELRGLIQFDFDEAQGKIILRSLDEDILGLQISSDDLSSTFGNAVDFGFGLIGLEPEGGEYQTETIFFARGAGRLIELENQYNTLLEQIDQTVADASYGGINLLDGDTLTTYFNEKRTSKLESHGQRLRSGDLDLESANFSTALNIDGVIDQTNAALQKVRDFGRLLANDLSIIQTREDFTKGLVSMLSEGSDKLTLADQNEEGAKLLSLQTRQSLGVTALSLAAQSQQAVLRLF